MKKYAIDQLRNIGLVGGGRCGKTSLAEALIYFNGGTSNLGSVDAGTTVTDFDPDEIERKNTHHASLVTVEGEGMKMNLIDTPGVASFIGDAKAACRVIDSAIVVVSALSGVKFETEKIWKHLDEMELPRLVALNEMDRERAKAENSLHEIEQILGVKCVPLQLPIGEADSFRGVIDLLSMRARFFSEDDSGKEKEGDVPGEMQEEAESARNTLLEAVAESDDTLLEKYLEGESLEDEEVRAALRKAVVESRIVPALYTVAIRNWGTAELTRFIADLLPSPLDRPVAVGTPPSSEQEEERPPSAEAPFSALVFKTVVDPYAGKISLFRVFSGTFQGDQVYNSTRDLRERVGQLARVSGKTLKAVPEVGPGEFGALTKLKETGTSDTLCDEKKPIVFPAIAFPRPVITMAVAPKSKGDEDKLSTAFNRLTDADALLQVTRDAQTREMLISAQGQQHVDLVVERLKRMGVEVTLKEPKVPYRETISKSFQTQYRHKKQTGGAGQFAEVHLRVEPKERDSGFEYGWKVFGGAISNSFQPSIEKGIRQVLEQGPIAGYPVVDVMAVVVDGKEHPVDSKDIAFQIAGREVFKLAVQGAGPKLIEPIMALEIVVPEEYVGDVIGDLNSRRGKVSGVEGGGGRQVVRALVPLAEMLRYATDLTSMTGGRGNFSVDLAHYEDVPGQITEKIIADSKKSEEEKKA